MRRYRHVSIEHPALFYRLEISFSAIFHLRDGCNESDHLTLRTRINRLVISQSRSRHDRPNIGFSMILRRGSPAGDHSSNGIEPVFLAIGIQGHEDSTVAPLDRLKLFEGRIARRGYLPSVATRRPSNITRITVRKTPTHRLPPVQFCDGQSDATTRKQAHRRVGPHFPGTTTPPRRR